MRSALLLSCLLLSTGWLPSAQHTHSMQEATMASSSIPSDVWGAVNKKYGQSAVNARVDRVWHAIPGLSGWTLNLSKSQALTRERSDGLIHVVWDAVHPSMSVREMIEEPIYRAPAAERSATFLINVSWGEEHVPDMLRVLKENAVKATFFLDGAWVKKNPALAKEILQQGHEVGSHGTGHPDFRRMSDAALERQFTSTNATFQHTLQMTPHWFAPPSGSYDDRALKVAARNHMYTILWTVDTVDWKRPSPAWMIDRVMRQAEPGMMVLMHPTANTAQALPKLIQDLRSKGYVFKTVGQVVSETRVVRPPSVLKPSQLSSLTAP